MVELLYLFSGDSPGVKLEVKENMFEISLGLSLDFVIVAILVCIAQIFAVSY